MIWTKGFLIHVIISISVAEDSGDRRNLETTKETPVCIRSSAKFCETRGNVLSQACKSYGAVVSEAECENAVKELSTVGKKKITWKGKGTNKSMAPGCMLADAGAAKHAYFLTHTEIGASRAPDHLVCRKPTFNKDGYYVVSSTGRCAVKMDMYRVRTEAACEDALKSLGKTVKAKTQKNAWANICGCAYNDKTQTMQFNTFMHPMYCYDGVKAKPNMAHQDKDNKDNGFQAICQKAIIIEWGAVLKPKNCFKGNGGADKDVAFLEPGYDLEACKEACENDATCNCVTHHAAGKKCWLRENCHIDKCSGQAGVQVVMGTRTDVTTTTTTTTTTTAAKAAPASAGGSAEVSGAAPESDSVAQCPPGWKNVKDNQNLDDGPDDKKIKTASVEECVKEAEKLGMQALEYKEKDDGTVVCNVHIELKMLSDVNPPDWVSCEIAPPTITTTAGAAAVGKCPKGFKDIADNANLDDGPDDKKLKVASVEECGQEAKKLKMKALEFKEKDDGTIVCNVHTDLLMKGDKNPPEWVSCEEDVPEQNQYYEDIAEMTMLTSF